MTKTLEYCMVSFSRYNVSMNKLCQLIQQYDWCDSLHYDMKAYKLYIYDNNNKEIIIYLNNGFDGGPYSKDINSYNILYGRESYSNKNREKCINIIIQIFSLNKSNFINTLKKELDDIEELQDIDEFEKLEKQDDMRKNSTWYLNGEKITSARYIALGRRQWYDSFAEDMSSKLGTNVYLLDYMEWVNPLNPFESLLYYIDSAERIDVSLRGLTIDDIKNCTSNYPGLAQEIRFKYMTMWEINQIYNNPKYINKTWWHIHDQNKQDVYLALNKTIDINRIV